MTEIKVYCDHCKCELDTMSDYIKLEIEMAHITTTTDLCTECFRKLDSIITRFCSKKGGNLMRDRLIELLQSKSCWYNDCEKGCDKCGNVGLCDRDIEIIADHILADGWIRPPCKVGQTVYCIVEDFDNVMEGHIRQLIIAEGIFIDCGIRGYFNQVFHSSKIGKTVFLNREDAEEKLKEGGKGEF